MSRKAVHIRLFGISAFSVLIITAASYAQQYYLQYTGNSFHPKNATATYHKSTDSYLWHNDTNDEWYFCPVNFYVPDGSTYFIKSIGMQFHDKIDGGYLLVQLKRKNLYTGVAHLVATWKSTGYSGATQRENKGTESGYKLVDTKKFAYFLLVQFVRDGDTIPGDKIVLFQVRIHYGT